MLSYLLIPNFSRLILKIENVVGRVAIEFDSGAKDEEEGVETVVD